MAWAQNVEMGHVTMTTPLLGMTFVSKLGIATINLQTKFDISNYSHYEDMNSGAKCRPTNWGSLGRLRITQGHRQCHHSIERIRLPSIRLPILL